MRKILLEASLRAKFPDSCPMIWTRAILKQSRVVLESGVTGAGFLTDWLSMHLSNNPFFLRTAQNKRMDLCENCSCWKINRKFLSYLYISVGYLDSYRNRISHFVLVANSEDPKERLWGTHTLWRAWLLLRMFLKEKHESFVSFYSINFVFVIIHPL